MPIIEGARYRTGAQAGVSGDTLGYGPYTNAGVPTNGVTLANIAEKGALIADITNGKLYMNTNTKASPTWTVVGTQT